MMRRCSNKKVLHRYCAAGPPVAGEKHRQEVVRLGEEARLLCPIEGKPQPIIDWHKVQQCPPRAALSCSHQGDERVDYQWTRYRGTNKRSLRIREVELGDAGRYTCKVRQENAHSYMSVTVKSR